MYAQRTCPSPENTDTSGSGGELARHQSPSSRARCWRWVRRMRLLTFLVTLLAAGPALGGPAELYEQGKAAYRLGEFDVAIAAFRDAYKEKPDPVFLYNIALAYRGKGDLEQAIFFYQSYLREAPEAANRSQVEAKLGELRRALEERQRATESPPKTPLPPAVAAKPAPAQAPPPRRSRMLLVTGGTVGGLGLLAGIGGSVLLVRAAGARRDVEAAAAEHQPWTDELAARDASGRRDARLGAIFLGAGAACLVAGGALAVLWLRQTEVIPAVSPSGVALSLRGRF
jgi:tetratricopeptide (TPR) repeat protein